MTRHRLGSFVLLAAGVALVFAGLTTALGFSVSGMIASGAAIAALLYAGGVWFGATPAIDASVVLFTPQLTVAAGPMAGRSVAELFPSASKKDIESCCRAALAGQACRVQSGDAGQSFEAAPVRSADGLILYGVLLTGALATQPAAVAG